LRIYSLFEEVRYTGGREIPIIWKIAEQKLPIVVPSLEL
jgi:hypothetical protein